MFLQSITDYENERAILQTLKTIPHHNSTSAASYHGFTTMQCESCFSVLSVTELPSVCRFFAILRVQNLVQLALQQRRVHNSGKIDRQVPAEFMIYPSPS